MTAIIGTGVSLQTLYMEDWMFTYNLASGITTSDIGKAVAVDTGAANKVKLAADNDPIVGYLFSVEDRSVEGILVGTVCLKGSFKFPVKAAETVALGDFIVGAGSGEVKALTVVADIALSTSDTYTDAAVNTAVNTAILAINARLNLHRTRVVEVLTGFVIAVVE